MTTTQTLWHDHISVNGAPYPTRTPDSLDNPDTNNSSDYLSDLPNNTRQHLVAVHEAGHAIATLAGHAYLHSATITPLTGIETGTPTTIGIHAGTTTSCNFSTGHAYAAFFGAAERAEDRWLQQHNLWTPRRALGIELGAYSDRQYFLTDNPHYGFSNDHNDYRFVHDLADELVTQHWDAITTVADALATQLYLTGQQIADLAQLPNSTHAATCPHAPTA